MPTAVLVMALLSPVCGIVGLYVYILNRPEERAAALAAPWVYAACALPTPALLLAIMGWVVPGAL